MSPPGFQIPAGVLGFLLMGKESQDTTYYTPWMSKGGNKGNFAYTVIATSGLNTLKVTVQSKKIDEDDAAATNVTTDQSITLSANTTTPWVSGAEIGVSGTGFKDLWRLKIVLNVSAGAGRDGWVHGTPVAPSWLLE